MQRKYIKSTTFFLTLALVLTTISGCNFRRPQTDAPVEDEEILPPNEEDEPNEPNVPNEGEKEDEPIEEEPQKKGYIRLTKDSVNLRTGNGTSYAVVGRGDKDSAYSLEGEKGDWYAVLYKHTTVYVAKSCAVEFYLEKSEREKAEAAIEKASATLGVPYVYGATRLHDGGGRFLKGFTKEKFDCSSLVQYAYYYGGVLLGTTTRNQVKQGTFVKRSELSRGDCIYFTNAERKNKTGIERVGHVAIYLGENYILHTASDYARIEQISSLRWSYYIESRRFFS